MGWCWKRREGEPGVSPWSPSTFPAAASGVDDCGEQYAGGLIVAHELFRMPLHPHDEATAIGMLDRLDDVVGRPRDVSKVATEPVHSLMVEAVHAQLGGAQHRAQSRPLGLHLHVVRGHVPGLALTVLDAVTEDVGR